MKEMMMYNVCWWERHMNMVLWVIHGAQYLLHVIYWGRVLNLPCSIKAFLPHRNDGIGYSVKDLTALGISCNLQHAVQACPNQEGG